MWTYLQLRYIGTQTRVTADIRDRSGAGNLGVIQAVRRHHFSLDSHRFRTFIHWGCRTYGGDFLLAQIDQSIPKIGIWRHISIPVVNTPSPPGSWLSLVAHLGYLPWRVSSVFGAGHISVSGHIGRALSEQGGHTLGSCVIVAPRGTVAGHTVKRQFVLAPHRHSIWKSLKWHYIPHVAMSLTMSLMSPGETQRQGQWLIITGGAPDEKFDNTIIFPSPHGGPFSTLKLKFDKQGWESCKPLHILLEPQLFSKLE